MIRLLTLSVLVALAVPARGDVTFLGKLKIPGNSRDLSGLKGKLRDGSPIDLLGGFGSGIAWTGQGNRYLAISDRGPGDGVVACPCRFHTFEISVTPGKQPVVKAELKATALLQDRQGHPYVGLLSALRSGKDGTRLDSEAIRVGPKGTVFIADEYGPHVLEFDIQGKLLRSLSVPRRFQVEKPHADPLLELRNNRVGRQPNRGFEGLAISPDGSKLLAMLQNPLIQDGGQASDLLRILEINVQTGATREFAYRLEKKELGVCEILAVNDSEFLVLERDHLAGSEARIKHLYKIDLRDASDVSGVSSFREQTSIRTVKKTLFLNLLERKFGLAGRDFPAKIEGICFGPELPDGRLLLLVSSDNDFLQSQPSWIFAFAIDKKDLPGYRPQVFERKKD